MTPHKPFVVDSTVFKSVQEKQAACVAFAFLENHSYKNRKFQKDMCRETLDIRLINARRN